MGGLAWAGGGRQAGVLGAVDAHARTAGPGRAGGERSGAGGVWATASGHLPRNGTRQRRWARVSRGTHAPSSSRPRHPASRAALSCQSAGPLAQPPAAATAAQYRALRCRAIPGR